MKLIIDMGNTRTKIAVFERDEIVRLESLDEGSPEMLDKMLDQYPGVASGMLSSVREIDAQWMEKLTARFPLHILSHTTPLPFTNKYQTPETLGRDRIAAAAAGLHLFPGQNVLVIDAGTCITYDIITEKGEYLGGAISPGLHMRFEAMHRFTGKLPLIRPEPDREIPITGATTKGSMLAGGQEALLAEVDGMIDAYRRLYPGLEVVIGGGDYKYFDKYLKNNIFAAPNLVLVGLKRILDFNEG